MKEILPYGIATHLTELHNLASRLKNVDEPEIKFYHEGARNEFFYLEAASRILRFSVDKKTFNVYYDRFKKAEDILGTYDYHEALYNGIVGKEGIDTNFITYFKKNLDDHQKLMREFLVAQKWIGPNVSTYTDLITDFSKINYPKVNELRKLLAKYMIKQLTKVQDAFEQKTLDINDIEGGIHEIRRKLRWVSIYAQVCNGWIQLRDVKTTPSSLKKYQTKETIISPFNKLPKAPQNFDSLIIDSTNFYALSWVIAELGKIKDQGMKVEAINEAIQVCDIKNKTQIQLIRDTYNASLSSFAEAPNQAKLVLENFFVKDKIAESIITNLNDSL